jgi:hypothetical protein
MADPDAFSLPSAVARYDAGCVQLIGAENVSQTDVRIARKAARPTDLRQLTGQGKLPHSRQRVIPAPAASRASDATARQPVDRGNHG